MNFALFLLILLIVTGLVWAMEGVSLRRRRESAAAQALARLDTEIRQEPEDKRTRLREEQRARLLKQPWWIEYSVSFFPTLLVGDFILVNKYAYGIRLPVANKKIVPLGDPGRGDVMVFRYPEDPSLDYIKRVVGLPGDRIEYRNKRLFINGRLVPVRQVDDYLSRERMQFSRRYIETLDGVEHEILLEDDAPAAVLPTRAASGNCTYNMNGLACTVPQGHYFVMGDNRDNSSDSRVWGFVPDENIVGKAFFIWLNLNELGRFGSFR
ncbi:MAG: signal peptidase I [Betaproteobacteria bacterium]|nr:MAG: signal peptidase I [Betaproteobacteria bacterium]